MNKLAENFYNDVNNRYIEKLAIWQNALGGALLGAGTGALTHMLTQPESERNLMAAALSGAVGGGVLGAAGGGLPNGAMGAALGGALGGGVGGLLTPNNTMMWMEEENELDALRKAMKSPYMTDEEKDAIAEMIQEYQAEHAI